MRRTSILLFFFFLHAHAASAQLQRKPWFGAQLEFVSDKKLQGCKVLRAAVGTSEELKLQPNDIITKIGNSSFSSSDEFYSFFLSYKTNDAIQLTALRGKKEIVLKGKVIGRSFESDHNATVIYDQASYKGGQLRVIINKPFKEGKMPALLFIPGYSCSSIDEPPSYHPFKRMVDAYVDADTLGFALKKVDWAIVRTRRLVNLVT